ncbi:RagB/SusD family nutrient uptake outer membrane protein [Labilibacter sediminis]|nr:RagB/SusD family nutrient uptake outer membrane protein [Labilibacter sediminis]
MIRYINKVKWVLAVVLLINTSCSDMLVVAPETVWDVDDFYNSEERVEIGMAGIYSQFAKQNAYGGNLSVYMEYGTDEGYYNRGWDELWAVSLYRHTTNDIHVSGTWRQLYAAINNINLFIAKIDKDAFSEERSNELFAEVRFLRGFAYSTLVSLFEEVPLRLEYVVDQSSNNVAAASLEELYSVIIEDLEFAAMYLPHASDDDYIPGRANKMAAHGILARVYMKMAGYPLQQTEYCQNALNHCDSIISDGWHGLVVDADTLGYRNLFLNYIQNKYDARESIFEISFAENRSIGVATSGRIGNSNGLAFAYEDDGFHPVSKVYMTVSPVLDVVYELTDKRREWNIPGMRYTAGGDAQVVPTLLEATYTAGKFRRWEPENYEDLDIKKGKDDQVEPYILLEKVEQPSKNTTGINLPVIRYADILLMYAEAANEINNGPTQEAIVYLNQIRNRAGLANIEDVKPGRIANKDEFFLEIMDERLRELCFEGLRKHDLIRWGMLGKRLEFLDQIVRGNEAFDASKTAHIGFLRAVNNFDPSKHLSLPYPLQEVTINNLLDQKSNW